ncbi:peptidoglycan DD-metalloendopeptidase family protein [Endozoicomonas sp. Mp262]|uniref:peptidoglycan DD-metalloendopeptidase family protein n=1 Tax=Endozoicomonas sp. Mp262 TaxID=2919499 RepID=UPI0021D8C5BC
MKKSAKLKLLLIIPAVVSAVLILAKGVGSQTNLYDAHEELIYDNDLPFKEVVEPSEPQWQTYIISAGDSFSKIASRQLGLTPAEVLSITEQAKKSINLSQLKIGQTIEFLIDNQANMQALKFNLKAGLAYLVTREESGFSGKEIAKAVTRVHQIYKGSIRQNLSNALHTQGVPVALATTAGRLLEKKNNLRRDLREGDRFDILVASDEIDGHLYSPKIEAVRINGQRIKAEIYLCSDGSYYDQEGKSLDPGFNRYPFEASYRISSPFNLHRKHPITGQIRPHYGTDFATPSGTPVLSPADGIVKRVGYQQYAGHYVVIEHFNGYLTRYFHLSKILVNTGDKVAIGRKIALTGNSGRTTGAHLHYELHKNGQPVNAMLVSLPESHNLEGKELAAFQSQVLQKIAILTNSEKALAYSESKGNEVPGA